MKTKQKYLVIEDKYFVDPHGSADFGGVEKSIKSGFVIAKSNVPGKDTTYEILWK